MNVAVTVFEPIKREWVTGEERIKCKVQPAGRRHVTGCCRRAATFEKERRGRRCGFSPMESVSCSISRSRCDKLMTPPMLPKRPSKSTFFSCTGDGNRNTVKSFFNNPRPNDPLNI